jgi:hypothetical protein
MFGVSRTTALATALANFAKTEMDIINPQMSINEKINIVITIKR